MSSNTMKNSFFFKSFFRLGLVSVREPSFNVSVLHGYFLGQDA